MLSSTRFAVAVHALTVLARNAERGPVCSSLVAKSVNTNPVVIRRLMGDLERAGLVTSAAGRSGGFQLSRAAETISLADVYKSVEDSGIFRLHKTCPETGCPIGAQLAKILDTPLKAAEDALEQSLKATTLKDIALAVA
jgi:Rrf2 family protein